MKTGKQNFSSKAQMIYRLFYKHFPNGTVDCDSDTSLRTFNLELMFAAVQVKEGYGLRFQLFPPLNNKCLEFLEFGNLCITL